MSDSESARPSRRWMAWAVPVVLILGLGALGTGISNASSRAGEVNRVDAAAACQALEDQIEAGREVDAEAAIKCDQIEFDAGTEARDAARAQGQDVALENSSICEAVNERAAQFDPRLALELALTCQQRELIVNKVNGERELSSLSQGVQAQKARGGQVAPYLEQFCREESLALADVNLLENAYEDVAEDAYANDEADYADADANVDAYEYEDAAAAAEEYAEADEDDADETEQRQRRQRRGRCRRGHRGRRQRQLRRQRGAGRRRRGHRRQCRQRRRGRRPEPE